MLIFKTPGAIDIAAVTTFGVSAKETASPIGKFGTGLKYAIAGVLRAGGTCAIVSGNDSYVFGKQTDLVRGKEFSFITMSYNGGDSARLGFTTSLGAHWEPWMFYRELLSNTLDENGSVEGVADDSPIPDEGETPSTLIFVSGLDEIHAEGGKYFLPRGEAKAKPLYADEYVEIFPGPCTAGIYFHGILAYQFSEGTTSLFTYNLLYGSLSEDRTISDIWSARWRITRLLAQEASFSDTFKLLTTNAHFFEHFFDWSDGDPGAAFISAVVQMRKKGIELRQDAFFKVKEVAPANFLPRTVKLSRERRTTLEAAKALIEARVPDFTPDFAITFVDELEKNDKFSIVEDRLFFAASACDDGAAKLAVLLLAAWMRSEKKLYINHSESGTAWLLRAALGLHAVDEESDSELFPF
jgi:hypothetical protein